MKRSSTPKDKLFQTAARLFYQHGYRAIGVDTIAAESGIGKMTLRYWMQFGNENRHSRPRLWSRNLLRY